MQKTKVINGIYFDNISERIDKKILLYLNFTFNHLDIYIRKNDKEKILYLTVIQKGKLGQARKLKTGVMHLSLKVVYKWLIIIKEPVINFNIIQTKYQDAVITSIKSFFRNRIVTIQTPERKVLFTCKEIILQRVTVE